MFCKKCGTKLADGDSFCLSCGTKVTEANTGVEANQSLQQSTQQSTRNFDYQPSRKGLSVNVIRFIIANAVVLISYFLGWWKIKGDLGKFIDIIGYSKSNSISPNLFLNMYIKSGESEGTLIYLLIVIPVAAGLAILFALLKKNGLAKLCTIVGGIVTLLFSAGAILLTMTGDLGLKFGVFVAIIAAIYSFIATGGLKLD